MVSRYGVEISPTMNRFLTFVGAVVLATAQPAVVLAHPIAVALPHAAIPAHASTHESSANPDGFKAPRLPDLQLKLAPEEHTFAPPARFYPQAFLQRRYNSLTAPGYLLYPAYYGSQCYANNNYAAPDDQQPFDATLGSLVDGKANMLSASSYNTSAFVDSSAAGSTANPFSVQAGFRTSCGAWNFPAL